MSAVLAFIIGIVVGDVAATFAILFWAKLKQGDGAEDDFYEPELDIPLWEDKQ